MKTNNMTLTVTYYRDVMDPQENGYTVSRTFEPGEICDMLRAVRVLSHKSRNHANYTAAYAKLDKGGKFEPVTACYYRYFSGWKRCTF